MRKKKYEKLLRRLCFAVACCLIFAGAAAPVTAFAAADPAEPGGSVTLIKAGTYRFNDVLTVPSEESLEAVFDYSCNNSSYSDIAVGLDEQGFYLVYVANASDVAEIVPVYSTVTNDLVDFVGWKSVDFQTIIIPNDTDVSVEFAEWFRNNTVPVSPSSNVLEGEWTFNDVLTAPSESLDQYILFSCDEYLAIRIMVNVNYLVDPVSIYMEWQLDTMGISVPVYNDGWSSDLGESVKTIDFGTEPQTVSVEFYEWFTSNAKPVGAPVDLEDVVTDSIRAPLSWVGSFINALISGPLAPVFSVFAIAIAISIIFVVIVLIKRSVWGV